MEGKAKLFQGIKQNVDHEREHALYQAVHEPLELTHSSGSSSENCGSVALKNKFDLKRESMYLTVSDKHN